MDMRVCGRSSGWRLLALVLLMLVAAPAQSAGCALHEPVAVAGAEVLPHGDHAAHGGIGCACAAMAALADSTPGRPAVAADRTRRPAADGPLHAGRHVAPDPPPPIA